MTTMFCALPQHPPLQVGACLISDYDRSWLESVLHEAAAAAGVRLPFCAEIAQGVMLYLERECPLGSVPLSYLFARLREVLAQMGLPRVAQHLRVQTPPVDIDLPQLAGEAPLPLFFYSDLDQRLEQLQRLGLSTYRFSGREQCSRLLGARRRACPTQRRALAELDAFIAARAPRGAAMAS
ncbi:MAG: hypothetical protein ACI4P8_02965 [Akkermansia sp.]